MYKRTVRQSVSQSQLYMNILLRSVQRFGFNCKLSSDTDKNMWRKYTHNTILLNQLISQPYTVHKYLYCLKDRTAHGEN